MLITCNRVFPKKGMHVLCTNTYQQTHLPPTKLCSIFHLPFFLLISALFLHHHFRLAALAPTGIRICLARDRPLGEILDGKAGYLSFHGALTHTLIFISFKDAATNQLCLRVPPQGGCYRKNIENFSIQHDLHNVLRYTMEGRLWFGRSETAPVTDHINRNNREESRLPGK